MFSIDLSIESPGDLIEEGMKEKKIGAFLDPESVLVVEVSIETLEEKLRSNAPYAIKKFEAKDESPSYLAPAMENESTDSVAYSSYLNIRQLFSPRSKTCNAHFIGNAGFNDIFGLFVVGCEGLPKNSVQSGDDFEDAMRNFVY